jgi:hypothetical protein
MALIQHILRSLVEHEVAFIVVGGVAAVLKGAPESVGGGGSSRQSIRGEACAGDFGDRAEGSIRERCAIG